MDKSKLLEQIQNLIRQEITTISQAAQASHEAATNEESKAEDQYDTRGIEASYLAGAQSARVADLEKQSLFYKHFPLRSFSPKDPIDVGALVALKQEKKQFTYFLVPQGGGLTVPVDGKTIQVISIQTPMGEELLGKRIGDEVTLEVQGQIREYEVNAVF